MGGSDSRNSGMDQEGTDSGDTTEQEGEAQQKYSTEKECGATIGAGGSSDERREEREDRMGGVNDNMDSDTDNGTKLKDDETLEEMKKTNRRKWETVTRTMLSINIDLSLAIAKYEVSYEQTKDHFVS